MTFVRRSGSGPRAPPKIGPFSSHSFEDDVYTHTYFLGPEKRECTGFVGWKFRAVVGATDGSLVGMRLIHTMIHLPGNCSPGEGQAKTDGDPVFSLSTAPPRFVPKRDEVKCRINT